jgi:hypothetical protein
MKSEHAANLALSESVPRETWLIPAPTREHRLSPVSWILRLIRFT